VSEQNQERKLKCQRGVTFLDNPVYTSHTFCNVQATNSFERVRLLYILAFFLKNYFVTKSKANRLAIRSTYRATLCPKLKPHYRLHLIRFRFNIFATVVDKGDKLLYTLYTALIVAFWGYRSFKTSQCLAKLWQT